MPNYEVPEPILNTPFDEPAWHWNIEEDAEPERRSGRRDAGYFYRDPASPGANNEHEARGIRTPLELVNRIRGELGRWRAAGYPGATRTTIDLLNYWRRDGRQHRLFFAQLEAAETVIFLTEARADFRQGVNIPLDEPSDDQRQNGFRAFLRYALKMATGTGKTTVMGMLAAWSILNKVADRSDARFSDTVLVVCPSVTIRSRLGEIDPKEGEASLYRTRDLVPEHLMPDLTQGRVIVTNWHVFEPQAVQTSGVGARVTRAGVRVETRETIRIGSKKTVARRQRYLTIEDFERQKALGWIEVVEEIRDKQGNLTSAKVRSFRYVESERALVNRVLGPELRGKRNILVFNDEAHHAYRIRRPESDESEGEEFGEGEEAEEFFKEATVWIEGLDKLNKLRGINFCTDLSATPYYLGRVGQDTNRIFPWTVSDFGLTDAIESGLTKIPQLVVRDPSGQAVPSYFNIWRWILGQMTPAERGGARAPVKAEAVLKYAHTPIAMLAGYWNELRLEWRRERPDDPRSPVFIIVCKDTRIAKVIYEWLIGDKTPSEIPPSQIEAFRNTDGRINTIRVDSKVVQETDSGQPKSDETAWMRRTLDTVGKTEWPKDRQGRPIYPEGFEELASKLGKPLHPPGRDVRCIVSVGMLTEGWDCNTVTHIVGLRPFMSQLLCEQVVGRGLRRSSYEVGDNGKLTEEVAKVFGVPFEIIPFKANQGAPRPNEKRNHVYPVTAKARFAISYPRVQGYRQAIRNRITVDWDAIAPLVLDPTNIPPEAEVKAALPNNAGRPSLQGPGAIERVDLEPYRKNLRFQQLVFMMAAALTRDYAAQPTCEAPAQVLFPQLRAIVERYLREKVQPTGTADILDVGLSPYYGWAIERLVSEIKPDASQGEPALLPIYETRRGPGTTAEVDLWTSRDVREVVRSHLNCVVADTKRWEQSAAYYIDTSDRVDAFVKNDGLGFAIPYFNNGQSHDYIPDFIVRLRMEPPTHMILEVKGYDPDKEIKEQAALRWVEAVNVEGSYGRWAYAIATKPTDAPEIIANAINLVGAQRD